MKARHFKKLRKLLSNKKWLNRKYLSLLEEARDWHRFHTFECNYFFRGYDLAAYNSKVYVKAISKVRSRIEFIKSRLNIKQPTK